MSRIVIFKNSFWATLLAHFYLIAQHLVLPVSISDFLYAAALFCGYLFSDLENEDAERLIYDFHRLNIKLISPSVWKNF